MLQDTQLRKRFWEDLGARFELSNSGAFDVTFVGDNRAKRDLYKFIADHTRDLQALVVADGDQQAINRFESVQWSRDHGRFTEETR